MTGEITHVPTAVASEALTRNAKTGRFEVLAHNGEPSKLVDKREAKKPEHEEAVHNRDLHGGAFGDATDQAARPGLDTTVAMPMADAAGLAPEKEADPKKAKKVVSAEDKARRQDLLAQLKAKGINAFAGAPLDKLQAQLDAAE